MKAVIISIDEDKKVLCGQHALSWGLQGWVLSPGVIREDGNKAVAIREAWTAAMFKVLEHSRDEFPICVFEEDARLTPHGMEVGAAQALRTLDESMCEVMYMGYSGHDAKMRDGTWRRKVWHPRTKGVRPATYFLVRGLWGPHATAFATPEAAQHWLGEMQDRARANPMRGVDSLFSMMTQKIVTMAPASPFWWQESCPKSTKYGLVEGRKAWSAK